MRRDNTQAVSHVPLETILKLSGVLLIAIYALLNVAYQQFYSPLGLAPEDVGIDQVFILARATALLPVGLLGAAAYLTVAWLPRWIMSRAFRSNPHLIRRGSLLLLIGLVITFASFIVPTLLKDGFEGALAVSIFMVPAFGLAAATKAYAQRPLTIVAVSAVSTLLLFSVATWHGARAEAEYALGGYAVEPIGGTLDAPSALPLALIDVQVSKARLQWIGAGAKPSGDIFKDTTNSSIPVGFIGQSDTTVFVVSAGRTYRIPREDIIVSTSG